MVCKVCESQNTNYKFSLTDKHKIFACKNCKVEFMEPQLNDVEITELYSEQYYKSWGISGDLENKISRQMKIDTFLLRLNLIQKKITSGKVLDIGCATGFFLEAAQTLGYEPFGVELSEYSSTVAKKKFGNENIFHGKLEDCTFALNSFNVITMFDLLEHVRIPSHTLAQASRLLANDGIIVITTPDNSSFSNKLMGKKWTHYKKEHFYYFDYHSLHHLSLKNGLEILHVEKSKKALNIDYLHTQLNVYKHWLLTPLINIIHFVLFKKLTRHNFHIAIGEITVVLKKK